MHGSGGIIPKAIESAENTEKSIIKELISEDIVKAQINGSDGNITTEELESILDNYGEIQYDADKVTGGW